MSESRLPLGKLIISIGALICAIAAISGVIDVKGVTYTEESFKRSLITFGIARGLNGVISVAQGTEIAVHPAGFGVNFAPGQILDPINDLVEQFSWIMLASAASLGIQKVLLTISSTMLVTLLLVCLLSVYLVAVWRANWFAAELKKLLLFFTIVLLFIRFSVPLAAIGSEGLYGYFLHNQYMESSSELEKTQASISKISNGQIATYDTEQEDLIDRAKRFFESASQSISINDRLDKYKEVAADATKHAINLIVVFVIQTIMFPLLFLWIIFRSLKAIWAKLLALG
ncbi:MAG: hypothetical protein L0Z73_20120 [Gammaproteobacteria bacterium]|nr:hypothetical protein [Gammaproteobacteria bacterium]